MELYVEHNGEYKKLESISDIEIDDSEMEKISAIGDPITMAIKGEIIDKDGLNAIREIASGFDRGIYNGMTLKEEGELTPKNAWL